MCSHSEYQPLFATLPSVQVNFSEVLTKLRTYLACCFASPRSNIQHRSRPESCFLLIDLRNVFLLLIKRMPMIFFSLFYWKTLCLFTRSFVIFLISFLYFYRNYLDTGHYTFSLKTFQWDRIKSSLRSRPLHHTFSLWRCQCDRIKIK